MKNNRVTFAQFCFSSFLSSLVVLLFIDYNPSVLNFIIIALSLSLNILAVLFYKGQINPFIKGILTVYLAVFSVIVCIKFCGYMSFDLGYSPIWGIALLIAGAVYFCCVKGIEPLYRASVIITAFISFSVIFIAVSSFNNIKFSFKLFDSNFLIPLILLQPSAIYILNYNNIIKEKRYGVNIYTSALFAVLFYFYLLPKDKVAVGIFKGADGVLLAVLTVAVIYYILTSSVAILKGKKHKFLSYGLYLGGVCAASILFTVSLY